MLKTLRGKALNDHSNVPLLPLSCLLGKQKDFLGVTAGGLGLSYGFAFVNLHVWRDEEQTFIEKQSPKWLGKGISSSIWCSAGGIQDLIIDREVMKFKDELRNTWLIYCGRMWER